MPRPPRSRWVASSVLIVLCSTAAAAEEEESLTLDEVIVTATKRSESVREISGAVSALTGTDLERLGAQNMADYLTRTPGVIFNGNTPGYSTATIRGVSTTTRIDQGQGTTGYFIDDIPLTDPFFAIAIPDIDSFDVDNVSVLRGPQGTLFGSASLGGAINYQTRKPDTDEWDVHVQATAAGVHEGATDKAGKVMVNAPLVIDKLAIRAVYIYREDAGYIDNIGTGLSNANRSLSRGGRIQALWTPSDRTQLSYLFLDQITRNRDEGAEMREDAGPLQRTSVIPTDSEFETLIHNLRFDQDLGFGTLTATAAYHEKTARATSDLTVDLGPTVAGAIDALSGGALTFVPTLVSSPAPASSRGKTAEVRFASASGEERRIDYIVGAMRDETRMKEYQFVVVPGISPNVDALFGPGAGDLLTPDDSILDSQVPVKGTETAAFGEGTYHFNPAWKMTLGGRAFRTRLENASLASGLFVLLTSGETSSAQSGAKKESGFTPKVSLTWTPTEDLMVYGLASKGFRYGGPNIIPAQPGVPASFESDSLWNYELGARTDFLDRRLQLDGTVFYIDWSDIQLRQQTDTGLNYAVNAGKARSTGAEASAAWRVATGLTFSSGATYLDAELREPFDASPFLGGLTAVPAGTTLPGASKWTVANTLSYEWNTGSLHPTFVLAHRFLSEASSGVIGQDLKQGGYHLLDTRVGVQFGNIGITAFMNNVTDRRGVASAGQLSRLEEYLVRPRTLGLTFDYRL